MKPLTKQPLSRPERLSAHAQFNAPPLKILNTLQIKLLNISLVYDDTIKSKQDAKSINKVLKQIAPRIAGAKRGGDISETQDK